MKASNVIKMLSAMFCASIFAACSSDDTPDINTMAISIAKQPEFTVTSGGHTLMQTRATRAGKEDVLFYFDKNKCPDLYKPNFPDQKVKKEECEYVYARIKEDAKGIAKYEVDKSSFNYTEFFIVSAYSAKDHDAKGDHSSVAGDMHDLAINGVYIEDFNTNVNVCADLVLTFKNGLQQVTYDDSFGEKKYSETVDDWKLFYIPENNGKIYGYYIGMDYHSAKEDTHGDGEYSDWVIKLIPATKVTPDEPINETNGSVEVNVNINDMHEEGDYIATKTSIHVRALTDVEIFLPIDKEYYCEADDMDISLSHKVPNIAYNTEPRYVEKEIEGNKVTFTVQYTDEGIRITTDGMCEAVLRFCEDEYADGLTFEVWNYFKDITREELKVILDKATITFLDHNVKTYVNAFAKRNFEYTGPIYSKLNDADQLVPYTDEACTQPLDQKFWTRLTPEDKDYVFRGIKNPWDCTVTPVAPEFKATYPDETDDTLPNFNVVWTK